MLNIQQEKTDSDSVLGFSLNGILNEDDFDFINTVFKKHLESGRNISAYFVTKEFKGLSFKAIMEDLKLSIKYYSAIEKIEIISDEKWEKAIRFGDFISPGIEVEHFYPTEKEEAIEWLKPYHD